MSAKSAKLPSSGAHTAGIYADMSVDGPEIGTLVAVVDRAKNLPNRKTMGKQHPYCAMRLGKEAKKTETDKRGGQTPKWDQELRFTVHESPDYYQLKVSVFNDDKKTELIGDAWVDLKSVVTPGGGQSDLWHGLQFKGKYAGDIRVELTYYDTRPKDEAVVEKRRANQKSESQSPANNGVGGPRELNPVKRRPLPADPTGPFPARPAMPEQSHSSPIPYSTRAYDESPRHGDLWAPDQQYYNAADPSTPPHLSYPRPPTSDDYASDFYEQGQLADEYPEQELRHSQSAYADFDRRGQPPATDDYDGYERPAVFSSSLNQINQYIPPQEERRHSAQPSFPAQTRHSPYAVSSPYSSSPPHLPPSRPGPGAGDAQRGQFNRFSSSPTKNDVFRDSPLRQSMSHTEFGPPHRGTSHDQDVDAPPPPPPVHRNSLPRPLPRAQQYVDTGPIEMPPLSIGSGQSHMSPDARSPLQQIERTYEAYVHDGSITAPQDRARPPSGYPRSPYADNGAPNVPSSLMAGYDPSLASPERNNLPVKIAGRSSTGYTTFPRNPVPHQSREADSPLGNSPGAYSDRDRQPPRSSVPVVKPRAISPNTRNTPSRKSVSPQPMPPAEEERRLSGIPFSPDSYDTLNPNMPSAAAVDTPASTYQTPTEAREAARQREVEKLRDQGPIIGNDGRIIDPSDHLPRDTWAPEYEKKPSKKPEVVVRFKHAPAPAPAPQPRAPMTADPAPSHPVGRPHSISTPIYGAYAPPRAAQSTDSLPQARNGRNRLQKPSPTRPLPQQPYEYPQQQSIPQTHSSPAVPTVHSSSPISPSPRSNPAPRNPVSGYPLRETMDYGNRSYGSSPRGSPYGSGAGAAPPPIPAKVPIQAGNQNWGGMDALSAELSTIDIGSGRSSGRRGYENRGWGVR